MEVLEQIKEGLQDRKLSKVAERTGVSQSVLLTLKNGTAKNPTLKTIEALVKFLGLKVKI